MAKTRFFAVAATILALCAAVSFTSCSGSDLIGETRETPISEEVSTSVDNTFVEHNWEEKENSFVDDVTSVTEYTEYEKKTLRVKLPATINWSVKEVLRESKSFDAAEVTLGEEVEDLCDALSKADTTVFAHDRELTETFAETTIEMSTRWLNGYVYISGEKSQLAYVQLDSVKAMPELTTVKFVEMADEANKIERDSFAMPHKAYYTEFSLSGKKSHVKTFTVRGTFLYQQVEEPEEPQDSIPEIPEEPQDTIPETPEEPAIEKESIVDASFITRWFDMDVQKSFMTLNCTWNNGETEELTFWMAMPFGWSFPSEWTAPALTAGPSKFEKLSKSSDNPSYAQTSESNASQYGAITMRRKVTQKTTWVYSDFEEVLTSYHHEGYILINGKDFPFMAPSESVARGGEEQTTTNEGNNSRERNVVTAEISFNHSTFHQSGVVNVVRANNEEPEEPETPAEEETPAEDENKDEETTTPVADENTIPSEWGEITGIMGVYRIPETINNNVVWHTCLTVRTTKGQLRVIDKKWKTVSSAFMSFDQVYDDSRMSAGAYKNGIVYPAMVNIDAAGWTYLAETKTGVAFAVEMSDQLAVSSGIKNFTKDNTAKPTPVVQYTKKIETVNGKKVLTVTCFNVDDKVTDVFTINCLLSK